MNNVLVQDICEVYIRDLTGTNKEYFFGLTSSEEITQSIEQNILRGGIGNPVIGVLQANKEIKFKVATALYNDDFMEFQVGDTFVDITSTVIRKTESAKLTSGKLTIVGTPSSTTSVIAFDKTGKVFTGTFATQQLTITGGVENAYYTVVYPATVTTGKSLALDSKKFPHNYYVELHTIAYDVETSAVVSDIYWVFEKALPDGNFTNTYQAGTQVGNEINFTAQVPVGATGYGKYMVIPRA